MSVADEVARLLWEQKEHKRLEEERRQEEAKRRERELRKASLEFVSVLTACAQPYLENLRASGVILALREMALDLNLTYDVWKEEGGVWPFRRKRMIEIPASCDAHVRFDGAWPDGERVSVEISDFSLDLNQCEKASARILEKRLKDSPVLEATMKVYAYAGLFWDRTDWEEHYEWYEEQRVSYQSGEKSIEVVFVPDGFTWKMLVFASRVEEYCGSHKEMSPLEKGQGGWGQNLIRRTLAEAYLAVTRREG